MIRRWFHLIFDRHQETPRMRMPEFRRIELYGLRYDGELYAGMKVIRSPWMRPNTVLIIDERDLWPQQWQ